MWNGKHKALTFSFDDGVTQDIELIKILNDHGLKATFNLDSGLLGEEKQLSVLGQTVSHNKIHSGQIAELYQGHEIAVHTVSHPNLLNLSNEEIIKEVEEDRTSLEKLVGYDIKGMTYPYGGVDDRIVKLLQEKTKIKYSRTVNDTFNFNSQEDLLRFNPTVYYIKVESLWELAKKFLELETEDDKIFYIWGHSYELDGHPDMTWNEIKKFCEYMSGKSDIFYGTNREILLNK